MSHCVHVWAMPSQMALGMSFWRRISGQSLSLSVCVCIARPQWPPKRLLRYVGVTRFSINQDREVWGRGDLRLGEGDCCARRMTYL